MKSEFFYCPHCGGKLQKSAAAQVMGEVGRFIAFGDPVITCPRCRGEMDSMSMIDGLYDKAPLYPRIGSIGGFLVLVGIIASMMHWDFPFWQALVAGVAGVGVFLSVHIAVGKRLDKKKSA